MGDYKMCMCFIRRFKINEVEPPFDVTQAFNKFTDGANLMTAEQLLRFLIHFQGETSATIADADQIIHQVMHRRHLIAAFAKHVLTSEDFQHFLFSDDLNSPITNQVHHDMTAPLSHYFTYTGHNSYLTGNQLSSDCSDAPIIKALIRGVRVIELDIWPNSTRDNVNVLHGRTLTTPVALIKCLKAIKEYAFSTSPYPVVITLEDHLNADLQAKVAEMVIQIFGDMLYFPDTDCLKEFPSPESLKYRIILSTKPPKEYLEAKNLKEKISSEEDSWDKELLDPNDGLSSDSDAGEHTQDEDLSESAHESGAECGLEEGERIEDEDVNENARESVPIRGPEFKRLDAKKKKGEGELRELLADDNVNESICDSGQSGPKYKHLHAKMKEDKGELKKFLQDGNVKDSGRSPGQAGGPEYRRLGAKKKKGEGQLRELLEDDEIYESCCESFQLQEAEYKHLDDKINEDEACDVVTNVRSNPGQVGGPDYKRLDAKKKKAKGELRELLQDDYLSENKCNSEQVVSPRHKRLTAIFSKKRGDRKLNGSIHNDDDNEDENKSALARAPEYKRLIAIHARKKKGGLKESLQLDPVGVRRLSLSEQGLLKARSNHGTDLVRFTQRNLLRVYPRGTRFDSSNYNPLTGWMHGAQMVAFNMQGYGKSLWLMQGMFRSNGGCGYVRKPNILMQCDPVFDPKVRLPVKKTLKVKIYMGDGWRLDFNKTHFDTYSPPDFYTRVGIAGVPADTVMHKTKIMEDDWTPVWDKEFSFPLTVPELALLRIEVQEYDLPEKNDFGGQTCLPVWELRPGIRAVPLFNRKGEKFRSVRLLMQFQIV